MSLLWFFILALWYPLPSTQSSTDRGMTTNDLQARHVAITWATSKGSHCHKVTWGATQGWSCVQERRKFGGRKLQNVHSVCAPTDIMCFGNYMKMSNNTEEMAKCHLWLLLYLKGCWFQIRDCWYKWVSWHMKSIASSQLHLHSHGIGLHRPQINTNGNSVMFTSIHWTCIRYCDISNSRDFVQSVVARDCTKITSSSFAYVTKSKGSSGSLDSLIAIRPNNVVTACTGNITLSWKLNIKQSNLLSVRQEKTTILLLKFKAILES